ncbi:uncharacterized protein K452DRAFT_23983 [Aplosporella prunicola CBS 121167]|uniref:Uncharacterized protein n=1 Tax=Aplosporella prunicola CBS 121167 TaxID=1176127 RepID=A0A6A6BCN5_9PEZI|nr:uncharacterized protein K452DRAFT_23983 [Aplosporella prunicola CBS 121167]KAF2141959.1 hypothetical protein K452DRAFT_23983 [Aplosporella prunicola CBS 121167]
MMIPSLARSGPGGGRCWDAARAGNLLAFWFGRARFRCRCRLDLAHTYFDVSGGLFLFVLFYRSIARRNGTAAAAAAAAATGGRRCRRVADIVVMDLVGHRRSTLIHGHSREPYLWPAGC